MHKCSMKAELLKLELLPLSTVRSEMIMIVSAIGTLALTPIAVIDQWTSLPLPSPFPS